MGRKGISEIIEEGMEKIEMTERVRRGLVLLLVCAFVITSSQLNLEVFAEERTVIAYTEGVEGGAIYFDTATGEVTKCDRSVTSVILPEKILGVKVTRIGTSAFEGCHDLISIDIPNGVTSIGMDAFAGCSSLKRVNIPTSMSQIGLGVFDSCNSLVEVTIPRNIKKIESGAFKWCSNLEKVVIPREVTSIPNTYGHPFEFCPKLKIYGEEGSRAEDFAKYEGIPFVPINQSTSVPSGKYGIFVTDSSGAPISGARVSCESYNLTTDSEGKVLLPLYGFSNQSVITVSCAGYGTYTNRNTNYEKNEQGYDIVVLYRNDEQHLRLKGVLYNNSQNLMVKTKRITLQNDMTGLPSYEKFSLKCLPMESGKIVKYELWQGNNKISTTTNGTFSLSEKQFNKGKGVVVRTYDASGKKADTPINLEFVKSSSSKNSIEIGEKLKLRLSDDIPIIGGQSLDLDLMKNLPLDMKISDDSVYFGLNVTNFSSQSDKDIKKSMNLLKEGAISVNSKNRKSIENLINRHGKTDFSKKIKVSLIGYGEAKLNEGGYVGSQATIYLGMKVEAKISGQWNWVVVVVPVTAQIDGKLSGEFGGKLVINPASGKVDADLVIKPKASASLYLGVGVGKALSAGGYGSVEGAMEWIPFGSNTGIQSVDVTVEAGIKAYVAYFEYKKSWAKKTWNLYTKTKGAKMQSSQLFEESDSQMFNRKAYHLQEIGYLANESEWLGVASVSGKKNMKKAAREGRDGIQIMDLLQGTYENSMPSIASNGEKMVMAYLAANPENGVHNMTQVMYSVFDEDTGAWKEPVVLDANGTGDYAPKLYSNGQDIYIIYQDSNKVLSEDEGTLADYAKAQAISVAWFDNDSEGFMEIGALSDNEERYETDGVFGFVNNKPVAAWVSNSNTEDVFCQNNTNEIRMAPMWGVEPVVVAKNLNCITALAVCDEGIVYATDTDNDLSTSDDQKLYLMDFEGHAALIDEGMISSVRFCKLPNSTEETLVWLKDGILTKLENNRPTVVFDDVTVNGDFFFEGNRLYYVVMEENSCSNFYSRIYDPQADTWLEPVKLTDSKKLIEFPTVVSHKGKIYTSFVNTQMTMTDEDVTRTCNLSWAALDEVTDLAITDIEYNPADAVDGLFPIKITFKNCGTKTVSRIALCVKDKDDETQYLEEKEIVETLLPGEELQTSFLMNVKDIKEGRVFEIDVHSADGGEQTPDDNVEQIKLDYADLAVNSELVQIGDTQYLYVTTTNEGQFSTSGMLDISCNEETTYLSQIPTLEPGEKITNVVNLSENGVSNNVSDVININVSSDKEEMELYDNNMSMYLDLEYDIIYDANGGNGAPETARKTYDTDYQISDEQPSRDGYIFAGWSTDAAGTKAEYVSGDMLSSNRSVVLYAVWRTEGSENMPGDVNGDGKINVTDINLIRLHILERKSLTQEQVNAADINKDSKINVTDINLIRLHILGRKMIS